jgi:uncharacterized protein DUF4262
MHHEFEWPEPDHEADEILFRNVRSHGCHIVGIDDGDPPFAFSVGLFLNYGHPELIIFGLPSENAQIVINHVRDHVSDGRRFADGDICDDLFGDGDKICFWQVPFEAYRQYLGIACWFYAKSMIAFPCLQIIYQDANHRFPWEVDCQPHVIKGQPLLKKTIS